MLAEHKGLAVLFAAILVGFAGYGWRKLNAPARHAVVDHGPAAAATPTPATPGSNESPSPDAAMSGPNDSSSPDAASSAQPVYIEAVPDKQPR